ncbi:MAG TPA: acetate/propionate family kinase [Actinomycetota bacterium]|nr:acetate/propionate family kinase [Actinomycetota bacterium]
MRVLVVNAGSSSLKLRILDGARVAGRTDLAPAAAESAELVRWAASASPEAIGHRVVHGGPEFTKPVRVDDRVRAQLGNLVALAPLHQPPALAAIDALRAGLPECPSVACFDTAFHATLSPAAATYALPDAWRERWGIRRYGFHGLSHAYAARRSAEIMARPLAGLRIVTCHLGAGASLAAVAGGRSVDTTMGFTPLEGLVMATRAGTVDPGLLLWLQTNGGLSAADLTDALERRSGLQALAGTADMARIVERARLGSGRERAALEVYLHRLRGSIAAMVASLGGLDALVFTGGVGENSAVVREQTAAGLGFLGVAVDPAANRSGTGDRDVAPPGIAVRTLVVAAREDLEIARAVAAVLA